MHRPRTIEIWTDGSCDGTTKKGGYGFIISEDAKTITHSRIYREEKTTSSRCELLAVIKSLDFAQTNGYAKDFLYVFTDSQYVQRGLNEWLPKWKLNGFRTSANRPAMNQELWIKLERLCTELNVHISWIRGHNSVNFNKQIDQQLTQFLRKNSRSFSPKTKYNQQP